MAAPLILYHTALGKAVANCGDDKPLKRLGSFRTEAEARAACEAHYSKVCRAAENFNRPQPEALYL